MRSDFGKKKKKEIVKEGKWVLNEAIFLMKVQLMKHFLMISWLRSISNKEENKAMGNVTLMLHPSDKRFYNSLPELQRSRAWRP